MNYNQEAFNDRVVLRNNNVHLVWLDEKETVSKHSPSNFLSPGDPSSEQKSERN
jgi:hypothetical protein